MRRKQIVAITSLIVAIVSLVSSFILYTNYDELLAQLGVENKVIQLADSGRLSNDYKSAIKNYERISKMETDLSPYAELALAEIYSTELDNKDYVMAIKYYEKAMSKSSDIRIYESALNLFLKELLNKDNDIYKSQIFDFENSLSFFTNCINKYQRINPNRFIIYGLNFPISENKFEEIFIKNKELKYNIIAWTYDYEIVSQESNLSYFSDNDKLVYITSFSEPAYPSTSSSFAIVTKYKYYHYTKKIYEKTELSLDVLRTIVPISNRILLSELKTEFQTIITNKS